MRWPGDLPALTGTRPCRKTGELAAKGAVSGALLVHSNLQMRLFECNCEQRKLLKTRENQRAQTGQVGLANRSLSEV